MKEIEEFPNKFVKTIHETIGANVQRIRQEKGISQLKLSYAIGHKSVSTISCAEIYHNGLHFNIEHLAKIAYVLETDICEFFEGIY